MLVCKVSVGTAALGNEDAWFQKIKETYNLLLNLSYNFLIMHQRLSSFESD
jgi:hypothetical protein